MSIKSCTPFLAVTPLVMVFGMLANDTQGAVITPIGVLASSEDVPLGRLAVDTINGSGLSGPGNAGDVHNADAGDMWLANTDGTGANMDPAPTLTYDLGLAMDVRTVRVWNYNEGGPFHVFGIKEVEILAGSNLASLASHGVFTFDIATGGGADTVAQDIGVEMLGVRFVKLNILSQYQDQTFPPGQFNVGLSEIRFDTDFPVPEPSTAVFVGLALIMAARKRDRSCLPRGKLHFGC